MPPANSSQFDNPVLVAEGLGTAIVILAEALGRTDTELGMAAFRATKMQLKALMKTVPISERDQKALLGIFEKAEQQMVRAGAK